MAAALWKKWAVVFSAGFLAACTSDPLPQEPAALAGAGEEACVPVSCFQLGRFCGSTADGCGGTLNCGTCGSGAECNELGYCCDASRPDNPCNPPLHAAGDVEYSIVRSGLEGEGFNSVDTDLRGNIFTLRRANGSSLLERFSDDSMSTNQAIFSIDLKTQAGAVALAPTLDRAFVSSMADVRSLTAGTTEMTFTKDGTQVGRVQNFAGESARGFVSVGYVGNRAFVDAAQRLSVRDVNDRLQFGMEDIPFAVNDAAFDIDGNVFAVGRTTENFEWRSTSWNGGQPFIVKFNNAGDVLWARNLNVPGELNEVSVTPNGFAVVSGTFTSGFTFANVPMESRTSVSGMVLGFDPKGADRFAYAPGAVVGFPRISMDQTGVTFVALDRPECGPMEVSALTFRGELGWRQVFTNDSCTATNRIAGIAAARGNPVVVGRFTGSMEGMNVELGTERSHGFLIKFRGK